MEIFEYNHPNMAMVYGLIRWRVYYGCSVPFARAQSLSVAIATDIYSNAELFL